jgi:hypothetical protein
MLVRRTFLPVWGENMKAQHIQGTDIHSHLTRVRAPARLRANTLILGFSLSLVLAVTLLAANDGSRRAAPGAANRLMAASALNDKASALTRTSTSSKPQLAESYPKLPLAFTPNGGVMDGAAGFSSRGPGYSLFLEPGEAVLELSQAAPDLSAEATPSSPKFGGDNRAQQLAYLHSAQKQMAREGIARWKSAGRQRWLQEQKNFELRLRLLGASMQAHISGAAQLGSISNYFLGNDPSKWHTRVPNYAQVRYQNVWPGVDLVYYGNQQQLEHDFILAPGADPAVIQLAAAGARKVTMDADGDVVLQVGDGEVRLKKPLIYQQRNGKRQEVVGHYVLSKDQRISFAVGKFDRTRALVIDPVLSYATYLGGSNIDEAGSVAAHAQGNLYVYGDTLSGNFPTTSGSYSTSCKSDGQCAAGTLHDIFVSKLNPLGTALIYSTYLGGSGDDEAGFSMAVDSSGDAYVTGLTSSVDFPTVNPVQGTFGGGIYDAFVSKLNPTGSALVYSTHLGGGGYDFGDGIAVDTAGNAYVSGYTESTNFPILSSLTPMPSSGLSSSTDAGGAWTAASGLLTQDVLSLAISASGPSTIYAGGEGVYKSADGGITWTDISGGLPPAVGDHMLAVDPTTSATVYVEETSISGIQFFQSTDAGGTWNSISSGLPGMSTGFYASSSFIVTDPVSSGTLYVGLVGSNSQGMSSSGVFKSTNGGGTWEEMDSGTNTSFYSYNLAIASGSPETLYLQDDYALYTSTNGGASWTLVSEPFLPSGSSLIPLIVDPAAPATLYTLYADFAILQSTDGGVTFNPVYSGPGTPQSLAAAATLPTTIYAGLQGEINGGGGVLQSTNGGITWNPVNTGLQNLNVEALAANPAVPSTIYGGTSLGTGFVAKLNPSGSGLVYSSYLSGNSYTNAEAPAVDASGNAYVTGLTEATNFPVTTGAVQPACDTNFNICISGYVSKINPTGSAFVYSTYLGGSFNTQPFEVSMDAAGDAYVTGYTFSIDFPVVNAVQDACGMPIVMGVVCNQTGFVSELNPSASAFVFSTYLGGTGTDIPGAISVDGAGNVDVAGQTSSTDFPILNPLQAALIGASNAFITQLGPSGNSILFSTYLGGGGEFDVFGAAVDSSGNVYINGDTPSTDFPVVNAFQPVFGDVVDVFLAKVSFGAGVSLSPTSLAFTEPVGETSATRTITVTNNGSAALSLTSIAITGTNMGDFAQTNTCGTSVAAGASCAISVTFTPPATGAFSASVTLTDNALGSPQAIIITGTGTPAAPAVTLLPTSLTYASQLVGTTSTAQTVTLTNSGNAALSLTSVAVTGTNISDFAQTNTCGTSVAAGASCTISVTFTPQATGARSASVTATDNASDSPQTVGLSGTGVAFSAPEVSPTSLTLAAGQSGMIAATVSSEGGFAGTVTVSCTSAPTAATCVPSPTTLTLTSGSSAASTVTVTTTARGLLPPPGGPQTPVGPLTAVPVLAMAVLAGLFFAMRRPGRMDAAMGRRLGGIGLASVLLWLGLLAACGGGSSTTTGTPAGNYTLTITAVSGSSSTSTTVPLTVQ